MAAEENLSGENLTPDEAYSRALESEGEWVLDIQLNDLGAPWADDFEELSFRHEDVGNSFRLGLAWATYYLRREGQGKKNDDPLQRAFIEEIQFRRRQLLLPERDDDFDAE